MLKLIERLSRSRLGNFRNFRNLHISSHVKGYEGPGKTTVTMLNKQKDKILINECNQYGFELNVGLMVIGPLIIFPRCLLGWNIRSAEQINETTLSLFSVLEPNVELLVLGLDKKYDNTEIRRIRGIVKSLSINTEILPVIQACTLFNFLNSDDKYVAGALIPPQSIEVSSYKSLKEIKDEDEDKETVPDEYRELESRISSKRIASKSKPIKPIKRDEE